MRGVVRQLHACVLRMRHAQTFGIDFQCCAIAIFRGAERADRRGVTFGFQPAMKVRLLARADQSGRMRSSRFVAMFQAIERWRGVATGA